MKNISKDRLKKYEKTFNMTENKVVTNAVTKNGFCKSCENYEEIRNTRYEFSLNLKQGKITNQQHSGRCWIFAATNFLRYFLIKNLNIENIELSQNYIAFYDKLEKSNYFLNCIIDTIDMPTDSRYVTYFLDAPIQDGGQWEMFVNLVTKYGIVPKSAMPETYNSSNTMEINKILKSVLRSFAHDLRMQYEKDKDISKLEDLKLDMMEKIYAILCTAFGKPTEKFDFEYTTKNNEFHREKDITPIDFYNKYIKELKLEDYISVINAPNEDKPYLKKYTVKYVGNVAEGNKVTYFNLPIERLKEMAIAQLSDGMPVFFGSAVGQESSRELGILSRNLYNIKDIINIEDTMDKATKLEYRESAMTHAMLFLGANLDENWKANRWRVENSWGSNVGNKGDFVLTDDWFDSYVYQVVVNKKHLKKEELVAYNENKYYKELEPWDPMGTLAD